MAMASRLGHLAIRTLPTSATRIASWPTADSGSRISARSISTTQPAQNVIRRQLDKTNEKLTRQRSPKVGRMEMESDYVGLLKSENIQTILPGTLVRPPLSRWPNDAKSWVRFLWEILKVRTMEAFVNSGIKFQSKPSILKRAIVRRNKSAAVSAAKALHRQLAEALATGDKETIQKVCIKKLSTSLIATVDARPRGRRYGWELVEYTQQFWYPSIRSFRMVPVLKGKDAPIQKQAVVAISSKQRRVEYDDSRKGQGKMVPGSEKEVDVVEYVTIGAMMDGRTYESDAWKIVGLIKATSPEDWAMERHLSRIVEEGDALQR
ncbi:hypothetical protein QBC35DRAFT_151992 [Podospora australis]|uniref:Tim44-like domain-containing protein n=1 Tax=Podospora australis TaxID=1536484 RepID=A0AAN6WW03_9PEZI|nr:hypothetical protein QBC35DRAFT_151992 [Podospora australis]